MAGHSPEARWRRAAGAILRRARRNTTPAGRVALLCVAASGAASLISPFVPIHYAATALFTVYLVGALALRVGRPKVALDWEAPEAARAGEPFTARFVVENQGGAPLYDLSLLCFDLPDAVEPTAPPPFLAELAPGERRAVPAPLLPLSRGLHRIAGVAACSTFPFGLSRRVLAETDGGLLKVDPAYAPLQELALPLGRMHQPGGIALTSSTGESPEYIGSREYRPGDPVRHLDHRSFARTGKPAVREYQEEYFARVALVLDTQVASGRVPRGGHPAFEAAVSLAAALSERLAVDDYVIDLFAAGAAVHHLRAGRHLAHLRQVLDLLVCVEADPADPFATLAPALADELPRLTTILCVFLSFDAARDRFVREAAWAGAAPRVFLVGDGTLPPSAAALDGIEVVPLAAEAIRAGRVTRL